jgi:hypothetical protein
MIVSHQNTKGIHMFFRKQVCFSRQEKLKVERRADYREDDGDNPAANRNRIHQPFTLAELAAAALFSIRQYEFSWHWHDSAEPASLTVTLARFHRVL